jgi:hypothetical protein
MAFDANNPVNEVEAKARAVPERAPSPSSVNEDVSIVTPGCSARAETRCLNPDNLDAAQCAVIVQQIPLPGRWLRFS